MNVAQAAVFFGLPFGVLALVLICSVRSCGKLNAPLNPNKKRRKRRA